jgi:hypothetical protein
MKAKNVEKPPLKTAKKTTEFRNLYLSQSGFSLLPYFKVETNCYPPSFQAKLKQRLDK